MTKPPWVRKLGKLVEALSGYVHRWESLLVLFGAGVTVLAWALRQLPPIVTLLLLTFALLALVVAALADFADSRRRIFLQRRWQALTWTHYRRLMSEALVRSYQPHADGGLDFVTFSNGQFARKFGGEFFSEMQYGAAGSPRRALDLVICDIEYFEDLRDGKIPVENDFPLSKFRPVPLERFVQGKAAAEVTSFLVGERAVPHGGYELLDPFADHLCTRPSETYGLPLRWGYTGVALKLSNDDRRSLERQVSPNPLTEPEFDLDWITDPSQPFYRWLQSREWGITMLDWYLPPMLLLAWSMSLQNYHALDGERFQALKGKLDRLTPLLQKKGALERDPLTLAERVAKADNAVVLGGGNWLKTPQSQIQLKPIKDRGYLLWCECLFFLAEHDGKYRIDEDWRSDANRLVSWIVHKLGSADGRATVDAFGPGDRRAYATLKKDANFTVRRLPPSHGDEYVTRDQWEDTWRAWSSTIG